MQVASAVHSSFAKGIGLRDEHIVALSNLPKQPEVDFLELAPENWMNIGGAKRESLQYIATIYPIVAHGLSLSIGDTQPLNMEFLTQIRNFLDKYQIEIYSEHLSFSRDTQGYLYELLPFPSYKSGIQYLTKRIQQVQDILERTLVLENISRYHIYPDELKEAEFIAELVETSKCKILLDINNIYVNCR